MPKTTYNYKRNIYKGSCGNKKNTMNQVLFTDKYNTIVVDYQKANEVANVLSKQCCAIKEANLGYGVLITSDGIFTGYGDSDDLREEINSYLDFTADLTAEELKEAKTLEDLVKIGVMKLVSCSYAETRIKG